MSDGGNALALAMGLTFLVLGIFAALCVPAPPSGDGVASFAPHTSVHCLLPAPGSLY
jgi:hypothetical protein